MNRVFPSFHVIEISSKVKIATCYLAVVVFREKTAQTGGSYQIIETSHVAA